MISIVLLLRFFNNLYYMHCTYNVVVVIVVVEINFNNKKTTITNPTEGALTQLGSLGPCLCA